MLTNNIIEIGNYLNLWMPVGIPIIGVKQYAGIRRVYSKTETTFNDITWDYWDNIPLSPKILKACGFKKNTDLSKGNRDVFFQELPGKEHVPITNYWVILNPPDVHYVGYTNELAEIRWELRYLDQLQNHYKFATGQDLLINEYELTHL